MFAVMPEAVPHVKSGKLHALGVMSPTRSPMFPQVPKMLESGIEVSTSTPEDVRRQITREIKEHAELVKAAGSTPQQMNLGNSSAIRYFAFRKSTGWRFSSCVKPSH
jgi:tripartite-type tricarboxylate transporter receptor subunit TctC